MDTVITNIKQNKFLKIDNAHNNNYVSCLIQLSCGKIASGGDDGTIKIWGLEK